MSEGGRIGLVLFIANGRPYHHLETIDMEPGRPNSCWPLLKNIRHETLIVVTADHETGGLVFGMGKRYTMHFDQLEEQTGF